MGLKSIVNKVTGGGGGGGGGGGIGGVVKQIAKPVVKLASPITNTIRNSLGLADRVGDAFDGPEAPQLPEVSSRLKDMAAEQRRVAEEFRKNIPNYTRDQFNIGADELRKNLASNIANQKSQGSSRGLLYGGIQQGAQSNLMRDFGKDTGELRKGINLEAEQKARDLEAEGLRSELGIIDREQQRESQLQQLRNNIAQQKAANVAGIGGLLGSLGGSLLGGGR